MVQNERLIFFYSVGTKRMDLSLAGRDGGDSLIRNCSNVAHGAVQNMLNELLAEIGGYFCW